MEGEARITNGSRTRFEIDVTDQVKSGQPLPLKIVGYVENPEALQSAGTPIQVTVEDPPNIRTGGKHIQTGRYTVTSDGTLGADYTHLTLDVTNPESGQAEKLETAVAVVVDGPPAAQRVIFIPWASIIFAIISSTVKFVAFTMQHTAG